MKECTTQFFQDDPVMTCERAICKNVNGRKLMRDWRGWSSAVESIGFGRKWPRILLNKFEVLFSVLSKSGSPSGSVASEWIPPRMNDWIYGLGPELEYRPGGCQVINVRERQTTNIHREVYTTATWNIIARCEQGPLVLHSFYFTSRSYSVLKCRLRRRNCLSVNFRNYIPGIHFSI